MDYLWTPWRYAYVTAGEKPGECIFCQSAKLADPEALIVHRSEHCFIILNKFPYTSGHVMIVPYQHVGLLSQLTADAAQDMMTLARKMEGVLRELYRPDGINMGLNIGKAAGAGVADHVHMHVLPRWVADANFMSVVGETRVLPEALETTWERMKKLLS